VIVILIALSIGAAIVAQGSPGGGIAAGNAVAAVWGNGVMANFRADPHNIPGYAVTLSMITAVLAIVFLIVGIAT
jgi:hypothetical protein